MDTSNIAIDTIIYHLTAYCFYSTLLLYKSKGLMKTLSILFIMLLGMSGCAKKEEIQQTHAETASVATPTPDRAINAVMRGHPRARQVCYDASLNGYFLHYKDAVDGAADDNMMHGWYFIQNIKFYEAENKTWFIGLQPEHHYVTVYPDVTGFTCKDN